MHLARRRTCRRRTESMRRARRPGRPNSGIPAVTARPTRRTALCAHPDPLSSLRRPIFRPGVQNLVSGRRLASLERPVHCSNRVTSFARAALPGPDRACPTPCSGDQTSCSASHEANSTGWCAFRPSGGRGRHRSRGTLYWTTREAPGRADSTLGDQGRVVLPCVVSRRSIPPGRWAVRAEHGLAPAR